VSSAIAKTTYTPGPWEVKEKRGYIEIRETVSPDHDLVATVDAVPPGIARDIRENARLISAAPELLEAGRKAVELMETSSDERDGFKWVETIRALHSAISKAEGR
jgi:hypothetical protein